MTVYLDTSVLFSAFHDDDHSERVTTWLAAVPAFVLSRWTMAEMSSALGVQVRMGRLAQTQRRALESHLDGWIRGRPLCNLAESDLIEARRLLRDDVRLRTPDALHLAMVVRHGFQLATLDADMADAARDLGLEVITP